MKMLYGVLILGILTAADVAAGYAKPQMEPLVSHLQTLFTAVRGVRSHVANFKQMGTAVHD